MPDLLGPRLERLYERYNRREYIHPDPLECVLRYESTEDQEIVAFIASSFAIGRVRSILQIINSIIEPLGKPSMLSGLSPSDLEDLYPRFTYRFYRREHLLGLLGSIGSLARTHGSLRRAFLVHDHGGPSYEEALSGFVEDLYRSAAHPPKMVSRPGRGSACKRLHLFLRWMIRHDRVDPGTWRGLDPARLMMPVDAHILAICRELGITTRTSGTALTSRQITEYFKTIDALDPVRFDFALTRLGIHPDLDYSDFPSLGSDGLSL